MLLTEYRSAVPAKKGERDIWQGCFGEHAVRDECDNERHVDTIHIDFVKHGYVQPVSDAPFLTFHRLVALGIYPMDWAGDVCTDFGTGERGG